VTEDENLTVPAERGRVPDGYREVGVDDRLFVDVLRQEELRVVELVGVEFEHRETVPSGADGP
jgi:hypothetical protein